MPTLTGEVGSDMSLLQRMERAQQAKAAAEAAANGQDVTPPDELGAPGATNGTTAVATAPVASLLVGAPTLPVPPIVPEDPR